MPQQKVSATRAAAGEHKPLTSADLDRVLDIAVVQFARQGFEGVSMRELSRESACPAPSIYYHFNSKSNLYSEAYEHKIERTIDIINARLASVEDKTRRFEVLVEAFFDLFTGDRSLLLLMQRDVIDAAVTRRRFLSQHQYEYFNSLIAGVASEVKGVPVSRETAFAIGALIFGYCELLTVEHEIYQQDDSEKRAAEKMRLVKTASGLLSLD